MGSTLSPEHEDLLVSHTKQVALMLDQDDASKKVTEEILSRLARRVFVKVIELPFPGDQPDGLREEEVVKYPAAELRGIQFSKKLSSPLMGED